MAAFKSPVSIKPVIKLTLLISCLALTAPAAELPAHNLSEFGPLTTPAQADAALVKAAQEKAGIVIIPTNAPADWTPQNISQGIWRKPPAPAPATGWGNGPGLTLFDYRDGTVKVFVPEITGLVLARTFALPEGQSAGHWEIHPMLSLQNNIVRGSTSYREWLLEAVKAGKDRRFYVRTIRGVFPGEFLNAGDYGKASRLYVKTLGFDNIRKLPYFVADVDQDVPTATLLHNKTHVSVLGLETHSITENQTFDVANWRHNYSQGDTYLFDGTFYYMSDVHSTSGDENGVIYSAFSISEVNTFRGTAAAWNASALELKFKNGHNTDTLASGRPIINLNPQKLITNGMAYVLMPAGAIIGWGGSIRSTDALWTSELIGRYFAIDEPSEYVPGSDRVRRWWLITGISEKDGVKMLTIQRHWWGAKDVASITQFYDPHNFTGDEKKPKLLHYIIAPGANVFDVARVASEQIARLAPGPHLNTPVDFAASDPIEQAIGPDPFLPIPFRSWLFDKVPGAFPAPVFDVANHGDVTRYSVLTVNGSPKIPWGAVIDISALAGNGIVFNADVENAALLFNQSAGNPQMIRWTGKPGANLSLSPSGNLTVAASRLDVAGNGVTALGGIGGNTLRGIKIPVPVGATNFAVEFSAPESTAEYAATAQPSWPCAHAVTQQTKTGFTVQFDRPAPAGGKLNWLILR